MVSVHQQFCHRIIGDAVKVCRVQDHAGGGIQRADGGYADAEKFSFGKRFGGEAESLVAKAEDFFFKRTFGFVFQGNAFGKQTVQPEGADNDRQLVSGDIKAQGNRRLRGDFKKGRRPANARSTFAFSFNDIPVLDQLPHDFGDCHLGQADFFGDVCSGKLLARNKTQYNSAVSVFGSDAVVSGAFAHNHESFQSCVFCESKENTGKPAAFVTECVLFR